MSSHRSRSFTFQLGAATVTLTPHIIDGVGARVMCTIEEPGSAPYRFNLSPDGIDDFRNNMAIAKCEAQSIERREQRRKEHAA